MNQISVIIAVMLCIVSSVTDIRKGIVPNRFVLVAGCLGALINILNWWIIDASYIDLQLANIGVVWLISGLLYFFHIWAGGDCKLMMSLAVILPYKYYAPVMRDSVTLISVLAFTFIISYGYLIVDSIIYAKKNKRVIEKNKLVDGIKKFLVRWITCISYITLADQLLLMAFKPLIIRFGWLLSVVNICILLLVTGIKRLNQKNIVICVLVAGILAKLFFKQPLFSRMMIINYTLVILFVVLRLFIDEYNYEIIPTSNVEKGMILSLETSLLFSNSKVKGLPNPSTEDLRSRLTEEEAQSIRRWEKSKYGVSEVKIVRKMPFAIFISLGTLVFIFLGVLLK